MATPICENGALGPAALYFQTPRATANATQGCAARWWQGDWVENKHHPGLPLQRQGRPCFWQGAAAAKYACNLTDSARVRMEKWEWRAREPSCSISMTQTTRKAAVERLCSSGRSMLLVGDSQTYQVFFALLDELFHGHEQAIAERQYCNANSWVPFCVPLPCGGKYPQRHDPGLKPSVCMRQTFFMRSSPLELRSRNGNIVGSCCQATDREAVPTADDVAGWKDVLLQPDPKGFIRNAAPVGWMVLNMGAHPAGASCSTTARYPETVHQVMKAFNATLRKMSYTFHLAAQPGSALWWRTHPGGHASCKHIAQKRPLQAQAIMEDSRHCQPDGKWWGADTLARGSFCWHRIPDMNAAAADIFTQDGHQVLQADPPLLLRADAHPGSGHAHGGGDCLHFCQGAVPPMLAAAVIRIVLLGQ